MIGVSALIGPFIMFTLPLILIAGLAIGPLVRLASEPPSCSLCHRELIFASRGEPLARSAPARPRRAPVGDMKAA
jgi:hypothetical protein